LFFAFVFPEQANLHRRHDLPDARTFGYLYYKRNSLRKWKKKERIGVENSRAPGGPVIVKQPDFAAKNRRKSKKTSPGGVDTKATVD
jgi:hypothetical protein